ncbi:unnamed protein product, partial [Nesidiocoris tenuis]
MSRKRRNPASLDGSTAQILTIQLISLLYQKLRLTRFYTFTIYIEVFYVQIVCITCFTF